MTCQQDSVSVTAEFSQLIQALREKRTATTYEQSLNEVASRLEHWDVSKAANAEEELRDALIPLALQLLDCEVKQQKVVQTVRNIFLLLLAKIMEVFSQGVSNKMFFIQQIMEKDTPFFCKPKKPTAAYGVGPQVQMPNDDQNFEFLYTDKNQCYPKTVFYRRCLELIWSHMHQAAQTVLKISFESCQAILSFIQSHASFLHNSKLNEICLSYVDSLEKKFEVQWSQFVGDNYADERINRLVDPLFKIGKSLGRNFRARLASFCPRVSLKLLQSKQLTHQEQGGLLLSRLVNNNDFDFRYNSSYDQRINLFFEWVQTSGVVEIILRSKHILLIRTCNHLLRAVIRRQLIKQDSFEMLLDLMFQEQDLEIKGMLFRIVDIFYLAEEVKEPLVLRMAVLKSLAFYDYEFFNFANSLINKCSSVVKTHLYYALFTINTVYYDKFKEAHLRRKCFQACVSVQKQLLDYASRNVREQTTVESIRIFMSQSTQGSLMLVRRALESLKQYDSFDQGIVKQIVEKVKLLEHLLDLMLDGRLEGSSLLTTLQVLTRLYRKVKAQNYNTAELVAKAIKYLPAFEQVMALVSYNGCDDLFMQLLFKDEQLEYFEAIKMIFIKINRGVLDYAKDEHDLKLKHICVSQSPLRTTYYQLLWEKMFGANTLSYKRKFAAFIAEMYTSFKENYRSEGERILVRLMKEKIQETLEAMKEDRTNSESRNKVVTYLIFLEELMWATEVLGLGSARSHISEVATSTTFIAIANGVTFGDDVAKNLSRKFPSNTTLFEVLFQAGKAFKCGPQEICLRQGSNYVPIKYNGMTLEELQLNDEELIAEKNFNVKLREEPLLNYDRELTPKAKICFTQIFNRFAVDGKMGVVEYVECIKNATQSSCSTRDRGVQDMFRNYDLDGDNMLGLDDFLRSQVDSIRKESLYRENSMTKYLQNLRYRCDLKKYDEPILIEETLMLRCQTCRHKTFQTYLFEFSRLENEPVGQLSRKLLMHLPTSYQLNRQVQQSASFANLTQFDTQYLLIAIYRSLSHNIQEPTEQQHCQSPASRFIQNGNQKQLLEMLKRLEKIPEPSKGQKKCLFLCLRVLRSLINVPDLSTLTLNKIILQESVPVLPANDTFWQLAMHALRANDPVTYEFLLVLQLTQQNFPLSDLLQGAFHEDRAVRIITCNFLRCWYAKKQSCIDLFTVPIVEKHCEEWFNLLISLAPMDSCSGLAQMCRDKLKNRKEDLVALPYDPMMRGYLALLNSIMSRLPKSELEELIHNLHRLLGTTISSENRRLLYQMLGSLDQFGLLKHLQTMIQLTPPSRSSQKRQAYLGINNLGAVCYMNSVLQVFFMIPAFRNLVLGQPRKDDCKTIVHNERTVTDNFLYQLQRMYTNLLLSNRRSYDPTDFCLTIKNPQGMPINTSVQEDAQEFLNTLMSNIEDELKLKKQLDKLEGIFGGKTVMELSCNQCKMKAEKMEGFYNISVDVNDLNSLTDSLKKFTDCEEISDYECEVCKTKKVLTKKTSLRVLPRILVFNLKRIIYDKMTYKRLKVHSKLEFPFELDVRPFTSNSEQQQTHYSLKGVIVHSGTSEGGHYYSIIQTKKGWKKFNDSAVTSFDSNDLGRECFGGLETNTQWGEAIFSTNAYILFYGLANEGEVGRMEVQNDFIKDINEDNHRLICELQLHQQAYFETVNFLFEQATRRQTMDEQLSYAQNWSQSPSLNLYERLYLLYLQVIKFISVYHELSEQTILRLFTNFVELFRYLPEKSRSFLLQLNGIVIADQLLSHSNTNFRNGMRVLLTGTLNVYQQQYGLDMQNPNKESQVIIGLLDQLLEAARGQLLYHNVFKSKQYFLFWGMMLDSVTGIAKYLHTRGFLFLLLEIIMGKDSPFAKEKVKIQEMPISHMKPIWYIVVVLIERCAEEDKPGMIRKGDFVLSEKQRRILKSPQFYRKILRSKYDCEEVNHIVRRMSNQQEQFSLMYAQYLLNCLRDIHPTSNIALLMSHLHAFLSIDDNLLIRRLNWVLGVPQYRYFDGHYALEFSENSEYVCYQSGLHYNSDQYSSYRPLLHVLYSNRDQLNNATSEGLLVLLQLLNNSPAVKNYMLRMPPPTYKYRFYMDWFGQYLRLSGKDQIVEECKKLYQQYKQLQEGGSDYHSVLPNYIVGKNKNKKKVQEFDGEKYKVQVWKHTTYVLENLALSNNPNHNIHTYDFVINPHSPESDLFISHRYGHIDSKIAQRFKTAPTMLTLVFNTNVRLLLDFRLHQYLYEVHIEKGLTRIGMPYSDKPLQDIVQIHSLPDNRNELWENKMVEANQSQTVELDSWFQLPSTEKVPYNEPFITCRVCTFANNAHCYRCEICLNTLY